MIKKCLAETAENAEIVFDGLVIFRAICVFRKQNILGKEVEKNRKCLAEIAENAEIGFDGLVIFRVFCVFREPSFRLFVIN